LFASGEICQFWVVLTSACRIRKAPDKGPLVEWHQAAARESLQTVLEWDFDRIVLSHEDLQENNAKSMALDAWEKPPTASY
jgi:hypothetical protein